MGIVLRGLHQKQDTFAAVKVLQFSGDREGGGTLHRGNRLGAWWSRTKTGGNDVVKVGPGLKNSVYLLQNPTIDDVETNLDNEAM